MRAQGRCENGYRSTGNVWQTLNIGKSPKVPDNLIMLQSRGGGRRTHGLRVAHRGPHPALSPLPAHIRAVYVSRRSLAYSRLEPSSFGICDMSTHLHLNNRDTAPQPARPGRWVRAGKQYQPHQGRVAVLLGLSEQASNASTSGPCCCSAGTLSARKGGSAAVCSWHHISASSLQNTSHGRWTATCDVDSSVVPCHWSRLATGNSEKCSRTPDTRIVSGAAHGRDARLCSGVVCQTFTVLSAAPPVTLVDVSY